MNKHTLQNADSTSKRPLPHPLRTRAALHCRLQPLYTAKHKVSCPGYLPNTSPMRHSCSDSNAFCSTTHTHSCSHYYSIGIHAVQNTMGEPSTRLNDPSRTRLTQELPCIAGCSHFTRKNTRFRVPASSPTRVSRNIHAAIPMRFAAERTHSCSHYNAIGIHTLQTTMEEPIKRRNDPSRAHLTQDVPFIAGCSHFTQTNNTRFRAPASSPTRVPRNLHAATTMCFLVPRTHSCSHYIAIGIHTLQNTIEEPITR